MTNRHAMLAYIATLVTICILAAAGAYAARKGQDASVYLAAITGLIGVLGTFKPRTDERSGGGTQNVQNADTVVNTGGPSA